MSGADLQNQVVAMRQAFAVEWHQAQQHLQTARVALDTAFDTGEMPADMPEPRQPSAPSYPVYSFQPRESQAPNNYHGFNYLPLYVAEVGAHAALRAHRAVVHGTIFHET